MTGNNQIFPATLISPDVLSSVPPGYTLRPLERTDYAKDFLGCLRALTWTGEIAQHQFEERFDWLQGKGDGWFYGIVVEHDGKIVGNGVLIVERKFIWNLGKTGHVEDIAVRKEYQGRGLGKLVVQALNSVARGLDCNMTLLDCAEETKAFYQKCGFTANGGLHMGCKMGLTAEDHPPEDGPQF